MRQMRRAAPAIVTAALSACLLLSAAARAEDVSILHDGTVPQHAYAARKLRESLLRAGYAVRPERSGNHHLVSLAVHSARLGPEAFSISRQGRVTTVLGGDDRGLIYGTLALAERVRNGEPLADVQTPAQAPKLPFRAIKFNLPWDTYRPSSALDQHFATVRDLRYWESFLDMMVENRFNTISLWNLHPFTYMVRPRNFPEASPWSDREVGEWQQLYRGIFRLAKERALDTYVVFWSIFVSREFSRAHGVARENFYPHYYVPGDGSELVRRYLRESVRQMLEEYRDLDGIGVSHGEGMAGMTPLQRQQWVEDVLVAGASEAARSRPVKLIHRVPFSAGLSSEPGASRSVEEVTRAGIEGLGDRFAGPIWVEIKFNWSHGHSTPRLVKVHGGQLGDTYFVPKPTNYRVVWQVRNEDFFALRWGVPDFIRAHLARNANPNHVGGYFIGSETYIPALDYFTATTSPVDWTWAFERQWLFYKLWGRLLYDPETPDAVFQAEFDRRYGSRGAGLLRASSLASNTQLRLASLYDSRWDFTLYSEGFLALQDDRTRYIGVDRLIDQPTMDPEYVSVADYVKARLAGDAFAPGRVTPPLLAEALERDCREALRLVGRVEPSTNASLRQELADIATWAQLGLHLAEKLRGAVALQTFRRAGGEANRRAAIDHLQRALGHWDEVVRITRPLYRNMRLTHYNHDAFEANPANLFHWALIRDQVAEDVEVARRSQPDSSPAP